MRLPYARQLTSANHPLPDPQLRRQDRRMRTIYTDRYAVQVWMPGLLGVAFIAVWFFHPGASWKALVLGGCGLALAAIAFVKRRRTPPDFR